MLLAPLVADCEAVGQTAISHVPGRHLVEKEENYEVLLQGRVTFDDALVHVLWTKHRAIESF